MAKKTPSKKASRKYDYNKAIGGTSVGPKANEAPIEYRRTSDLPAKKATVKKAANKKAAIKKATPKKATIKKVAIKKAAPKKAARKKAKAQKKIGTGSTGPKTNKKR